MPEAVIRLLESEVAEAQKAADAGKSVGRRIDAAKQRLREATNRLEAKARALSAAQEAKEKAVAEISEAYAELTRLMTEEASAKGVEREDQARLRRTNRATVTMVSQLVSAVRTAWPAANSAGQQLVPEDVVSAARAAEDMMKELAEDEHEEPPEMREAPPTGEGPCPKRAKSEDSVMTVTDDGEHVGSSPPGEEEAPSPQQAARPGGVRDALNAAELLLPELRGRSRSPVSRGVKQEGSPQACPVAGGAHA